MVAALPYQLAGTIGIGECHLLLVDGRIVEWMGGWVDVGWMDVGWMDVWSNVLGLDTHPLRDCLPLPPHYVTI